jgi:hypothetical protein
MVLWVIGFAELIRLKWDSVAFGRPDSFSVDEKNYARDFITTYKILCTGRTPAAETKSRSLVL